MQLKLRIYKDFYNRMLVIENIVPEYIKKYIEEEEQFGTLFFSEHCEGEEDEIIEFMDKMELIDLNEFGAVSIDGYGSFSFYGDHTAFGLEEESRIRDDWTEID